MPLELHEPRIRHSLVERARERVREARARIEGGYYDRADVRRALAEALLVEFAPTS